VSSPKPKQPPDDNRPAAEEIEWTEEDDAIMDRVWADLRKKLDGKLPSQIQKEQELSS
jgi:hypothetical protein